MNVSLHEGQTQVYSDLMLERLYRFIVVNCSRGWGKSFEASVIAVTAIYELMELAVRVPNKVVYIIAPTHDQVTDIYWPIIAYDLGMEDIAIKSSQDLGRFLFPGRVELRLISYESVERLRGKGAYLVVWDEVSSCKKGSKPKDAWEGVIRPCISTRWSPARAKLYGAKSPGRAVMISTPKGYNFFAEALTYEETDSDWKSYHFDYTQSPLLDIEEIEKQKANMDPFTWASEYLALIKESGNNVFYCFDRKKQVVSTLEDFNAEEDVHCFIDFNVGIQATSFGAVRGNELHILDYVKGLPDTENLAKYIKAKYPEKTIIAYPDPTGRSRKASAAVGRTDFSILQSSGIQVLARSSSPPIVDSVAAVNRLCLDANGNTRLFFHPRAKGPIESIEKTKWVDNNPDIAMIDKSEGLEHFSDGLRYGIEYRWPVVSGQKVVQRGKRF